MKLPNILLINVTTPSVRGKPTCNGLMLSIEGRMHSIIEVKKNFNDLYSCLVDAPLAVV